ncbi:MAG: acyl-CoA reductase [Bacteroidales bacterium]|jgi:hypothetical protein|nr:acyl-CoA reductase [Bacteroidales bacterium]
MEQEKIIDAFCFLQKELSNCENNSKIQKAIEKTRENNPLLSYKEIVFQIKNLSLWLEKDSLICFANKYCFNQNPKTIAIICAGNIPCVGFHDILCTLLSGNKALCRLSSSDKFLLPVFADILIEKEPLLSKRIKFTDNIIKGFDAVIATGSNNTNRYFDYYFSSYPNIIRHSRTSVAVLDNSQKDIEELFYDIFSFKGLGCRNVSKIFIPEGFDFSFLTDKFSKHSHLLLDNDKYMDNYNYQKAIMIMNNLPFIDLNSGLMVESKELFSPISVVYYEYYKNINDVREYLEMEKENIQVVVSNIEGLNCYDLGQGQRPNIYDFADNRDTMQFLCSLE